jgi:hypothetical protein
MQINVSKATNPFCYTCEYELKPLDHLTRIVDNFNKLARDSASRDSLIQTSFNVYLYGSYPIHEVEKVKEVFVRILKLAKVDVKCEMTDRLNQEMKNKPLNMCALERLVDLGAEASGHHLIEACESGFTDCVPALLRGRADVNHKADRERTPLWIASGCGRHEIVDMLLNAGADTQIKTYSKTPFEWAVERRQNDVVKTYIKLYKVTQSELSTALPILIKNCEESDWSVDVLKTLIDNGANMEQKTAEGLTLSEFANRLRKPLFAKELTKNKVL